MNIIEVIYALAFISLGIISSATDLKEGIVYNRHVLIFAVIGVTLDIFYFGIYARTYLTIYIINCLCIGCISFLLYITHSFAGGDCKLAIVLAILYPAKYYVIYSGSSLTLFFALGYALILGYIYLVGSAILKLVRKNSKISLAYVKNYFEEFFKSFFRVFIYVSALNYLFIIVMQKGIILNTWMIRMICIMLAIVVGKSKVLKKRYVIFCVTIVDCVIGVFFRVLPFSVNVENYILVIILMVLQMITKTNLYKEIELNNLKKGMILSSMASLMMQNSRVKGLPGISSENLKNRLSEEEVESVKRWGKGKNIQSIVVVKKIPFVLFMILGFFVYYLTRNTFL